MKKPLICLALAILIGIGIADLAWIARNYWQSHIVTEITQERSPQLGHFPVYKVILRPHESTYIGQSGTSMIGTYTSHDVDYSSCVREFKQSSFFSLWGHYFTLGTDMPNITTSAAYTGGRKTVEDYGCAGPKSLSDLETQIDQAVARAHWHKVSGTDSW